MIDSHYVFHFYLTISVPPNTLAAGEQKDSTVATARKAGRPLQWGRQPDHETETRIAEEIEREITEGQNKNGESESDEGIAQGACE